MHEVPLSPPSKLPLRLGVALAIVWLCLAVPLLSDYGPTFDEVLGELPWGERYLRYALGGDRALLDAPNPSDLNTLRSPDLDLTVPGFGWAGTHPLCATLCAATARIFWVKLGILGALEARHLAIPLFTALLLIVVTTFIGRRVSPAAGLASGLCILLSPAFFAHSFSNPKDAPEAVLYACALIAGVRAIESRRKLPWVLAGAVAGLALAQKANALFLGPHGLLLVLVAYVPTWWRGGAKSLRTEIVSLLRGALVAAIAAAGVYLAVSPMMWKEPVAHVRELYTFIANIGRVDLAQQEAAGIPPPPLHVIFDGPLAVLQTTPLALLILGFAGLWSRALRGPLRALVLLGIAIPVGRTLLPGMRNFDGTRHFLEYWPFFAILAGLGFCVVRDALLRVTPRLSRGGSTGVVAIALLLPPAVEVGRTHPHGIAAFNVFVGGLAGAQERGFAHATDYWGGSYWQGLEWLDTFAERGAFLNVGVASHIVEVSAPLRLRSDIRRVEIDAGPGLPVSPESPVYVMYVTRPFFYHAGIRLLDARKLPAFEIRVQGGVILKIQRLTNSHEWTEFRDVILAEQAAQARVYAWLLTNPPNAALAQWHLLRAQARFPGVANELRTLLPPELQDCIGPLTTP